MSDLPNRCPSCFEPTTEVLSRRHPCGSCGWSPGSDNTPPFLALGTRLDGRYCVGRVLGQGGFGLTYHAWDENLALPVAIKEYLPRDCATRAGDGHSLSIYSSRGADFAYGLERFVEEARTLAQFDEHPGVVGVKNYFRAHATAYIVMDYVPGFSLKDYLERQGGRLPFDHALPLLLPVIDALRAVHAAGLLHRDIAPDNIRLTPSGQVRLLDFGAARQASAQHSRSLSVILKPGYAPPEQYRSRGKQGPWTDVYALAATLYRCLTGQTPPEALDRQDEDDLRLPSVLGIAIPPALEDSLARALALRVDERTPDIQTLRGEWQAVLERKEPPPPPPPPEPPKDPPPPDPPPEPPRGEDPPVPDPAPRWKSVLAMGLGVIVLSGLVGLVAWNAKDGGDPAPSPQAREQDRAAYAEARSLDTKAGYRAYLRACPSWGCAHQGEALSALDALIDTERLAAEQAAAAAKQRADELAARQQADREARAKAEQAEAERRAEAERQAQAEAEREPKPGDSFRDPLRGGGEGPEMVIIPAGSFTMGSNQGGNDEKPPHRVTISRAFALGKTEVTFADYDRFCAATGRSKPNDNDWGRGTRPVINVSWEDATAYAQWLSEQTGEEYRLPTEAEWEYAARAGTETKYWWGNAIGKNRAVCLGCGSRWDDKRSTAPVGSFAANPFGLYDTAGNVWEWVFDWFDSDAYASHAGTDPVVKQGDSYRVLRGGGWFDTPRRQRLRSAYRSALTPGSGGRDIGFRLARTL